MPGRSDETTGRATPPWWVWVALPLCVGCSEQAVKGVDRLDVFTQGADHVPSDVLFVVDDSSSMAEEQARLAGGFDAFVAALPENRADYQLGVVTTSVEDPAEAGLLVGGTLPAALPDIVERFRAAVQVGTRGNRDEQGLEAARLAVTPDRNPGFLRPQARLQIVVLSDEDDQSPGEVGAILGELAERAGEQGMVVHGIVGDLPRGCASGTSAADAGARYVEAIDATGGIRESLCVEDYGPMLGRLALELSSRLEQFGLAAIPRPDTLRVDVDGVRIPERGIDGWTFDPGDNAVVFHGWAIPADGSTIEVRYVPWSGD